MNRDAKLYSCNCIAEKYFAGARGSTIRFLDVPLAVRNGTGPVDLICVYEVDEDENGLVIKWFHEAYQIYQWIPPSNSPPTRSHYNLYVGSTYLRVIKFTYRRLRYIGTVARYREGYWNDARIS